MRRSAILVAGSAGAVAAAIVLILAFAGGGKSTSSALADAEAGFRSTIRSGQVVHTITVHYRRGSSPEGPIPTGIAIGPDTWTEESYTSLTSEGSVAEQVTFQVDPDGKSQKTRSISGSEQTLYDADGAIRQQISLAGPQPFDVGASSIVEFVHRAFPSGVKEQVAGGVVILEGQIDDPRASHALIPPEELEGIKPTKVVVRYEIDTTTGLLVLFREVAVNARGTQTVIGEDKVTTAELIPAPSFFPVGGQ